MTPETEEVGEVVGEVLVSTCSFSKQGKGLQVYFGNKRGFAQKILEGMPLSVDSKSIYKVKYYTKSKKIVITEL